MIRYWSPNSRSGSHPIPTFCVNPNRSPLDQVRSISSVSGNDPSGPLAVVASDSVAGTGKSSDPGVEVAADRPEGCWGVDTASSRQSCVDGVERPLTRPRVARSMGRTPSHLGSRPRARKRLKTPAFRHFSLGPGVSHPSKPRTESWIKHKSCA
jgi:hypothetical protein